MCVGAVVKQTVYVELDDGLTGKKKDAYSLQSSASTVVLNALTIIACSILITSSF